MVAQAAATVDPAPLAPVPVITRTDDAQSGNDFDETRRVLLIYTGGTMGMTKQNGSLAPMRGFLPTAIREMPEVRDASMPELDIIEYDPLLDSSNVSVRRSEPPAASTAAD